MKALIQRVRQAQVTVGEETVGAIGPGLLVLLGVEHGDTEEDALTLADKTAHLRIFSDEQGRFNLSALDVVEGSACFFSPPESVDSESPLAGSSDSAPEELGTLLELR